MPDVFHRASNAEVWAEDGTRYIDLLAGCGALNYGHNPPAIRDAVVSYMVNDGITSSMDLHTTAKEAFLETFEAKILEPRGMSYKIQFCGPTGTNAVEAALKLARQVTSRETVVGFSKGFHGMTLGALAVTTNKLARRSAGVPLENVVRLPFDAQDGTEAPYLSLYESYVQDNPSLKPAAFILETVQGEGGLSVASKSWLVEVERTARRLGALVIIDDVQAGCGRTGDFFSFERSGIKPDLVCLSKAVGGMGMPMALVLIKPELDIWIPGAHNGTFRGNNLAFVAARVALEQYWSDDTFSCEVVSKARYIRDRLEQIADRYPAHVSLRGLGLMQGLAFDTPSFARKVAHYAFVNGILIETCGSTGEVVKLMPPLTIPLDLLAEAIDVIEFAVDELLGCGSDCDAHAAALVGELGRA